MTTLAVAVLCLATLGYVLWPVLRPSSHPKLPLEPRAEAQPQDGVAQPAGRPDGEPLPLEQLQPPPGKR